MDRCGSTLALFDLEQVESDGKIISLFSSCYYFLVFFILIYSYLLKQIKIKGVYVAILLLLFLFSLQSRSTLFIHHQF